MPKLGEVKTRGKYACAALALVPMAGAFVGGAVDEYLHLGYSNWVSACRTAGPSPLSLLRFTFELLPGAVIGFLLAGFAVQAAGILLCRVHGVAQAALAAHAGCMLGMAAGLLLCALALPLPWMLGAEALLAALAAVYLFRRIRRSTYPVAG